MMRRFDPIDSRLYEDISGDRVDRAAMVDGGQEPDGTRRRRA